MKLRVLLCCTSISALLLACEPDTVSYGTIDKVVTQTHQFPVVSPEGSKMAFQWYNVYNRVKSYGMRIIDLQTLEAQDIDLTRLLPDSMFESTTVITSWCPYDENRVLIHWQGFIDTSDGKGRRAYATETYIMALDGSELTRITPLKETPGIRPEIGTGSWMWNSRPGEDYIEFWIESKHYIYSVQKDVLTQTAQSYIGEWSRDGKCFGPARDTDRSSSFQDKFMLGMEPAYLQFAAGGINHLSWSPDGKKIALSNSTGFEYNPCEIWILDIDKYTRNRLLAYRFVY
jgi:hypothetical protein